MWGAQWEQRLSHWVRGCVADDKHRQCGKGKAARACPKWLHCCDEQAATTPCHQWAVPSDTRKCEVLCTAVRVAAILPHSRGGTLPWERRRIPWCSRLSRCAVWLSRTAYKHGVQSTFVTQRLQQLGLGRDLTNRTCFARSAGSAASMSTLFNTTTMLSVVISPMTRHCGGKQRSTDHDYRNNGA